MPDQQNKTQTSDSAEESPISDHKALDQFCKNIGLDEVSLEAWCHHHTSLDLTYTMTVKRDELAKSQTKEIKMSRTVTCQGPQGKLVKREKVKHEIMLSPQSEDLQKIVIRGGGDIEMDAAGDLVIVIRFT